MNQIEFNLILKINGKPWIYSSSKEYTDEEMTGEKRPQALFQELCKTLTETLLKREYKKKLSKKLAQIDYDQRITEPLLKAQRELRSKEFNNPN